MKNSLIPNSQLQRFDAHTIENNLAFETYKLKLGLLEPVLDLNYLNRIFYVKKQYRKCST